MQRTIEATNNSQHHVPRMICLEYRPRKASRKWRVAFRMHEAGRENMKATAAAMSKQDGWYDWRIVTERIVAPA